VYKRQRWPRALPSAAPISACTTPATSLPERCLGPRSPSSGRRRA